ncbi:putative cytochrome P450 [Lupinus albus]|uniref:Putative cytochrome P450 n=1 Tax=Lupinus albus TaxID=3870 RepID=A0A6A4QD83_LUPAL|nr:putative cytochrome P450 [Lupinus albus]
MEQSKNYHQQNSLLPPPPPPPPPFPKHTQYLVPCSPSPPTATATFILHRSFGSRQVFTANPANVQHILKTQFPIYYKGPTTNRIIGDFLGNGIFNADGDTWKFQRQHSSHEFNTRSLRKFVETVVDTELSQRLIPILSQASKTQTTLHDFQDILQRFTFDNICRIAFGIYIYILPRIISVLYAFNYLLY